MSTMTKETFKKHTCVGLGETRLPTMFWASTLAFNPLRMYFYLLFDIETPTDGGGLKEKRRDPTTDFYGVHFTQQSFPLVLS